MQITLERTVWQVFEAKLAIQKMLFLNPYLLKEICFCLPSKMLLLCVCVRAHLLNMLLQLVLSGRRGRLIVNDLSWSADFLVCIGFQKHSLIKVSHRQHVLLILPVYGFTGHTHTQI